MQQPQQQVGDLMQPDFGSPSALHAHQRPPNSQEDPNSAPMSPHSTDDQASMIHPGSPESDLDTDHFYMYIYKVAPCLKNYTHDWSACPFAHKGEKAARRDPLKFSYMASNCPDHKRGACPRGDSCTFSHGVFESCLHPERYRTQMCNSGANCKRSVCFFAHSTAELRSPYCQNSPSQIDATTVSTLRALLGSTAGARGGSDDHASPQQRRMQASAMLRNAMSSMPAMHPPTSFQAAAPGAPGHAGAPGGGDILNQACNLLCALQLLGNKADPNNATNDNALNALRSHSQHMSQPGSSMFGGLGRLDQFGAEAIDWGSLGINDSNQLSMLLNRAGANQGSKPDMGIFQPQSEYGSGIPAYHAPQPNFSYMAS